MNFLQIVPLVLTPSKQILRRHPGPAPHRRRTRSPVPAVSLPELSPLDCRIDKAACPLTEVADTDRADVRTRRYLPAGGGAFDPQRNEERDQIADTACASRENSDG